MKCLSIIIFYFFILNGYAKEWKSLRCYQKETGFSELRPSDWLKKDRKKNTLTWQQANLYNLQNNLPQEYETIKQRRDFYEWFYKSLEARDYEVIWPKMAYYISNKLRLTKAFPYNIFTTKDLKSYAYKGSIAVFDKVFEYLKTLYEANTLKGEAALQWDKEMLYKEQHLWIQGIYDDVGEKTLRTISRMAKGKGFYGLVVPKEIRFQGDISSKEIRYQYALKTLRTYCKTHFE